MKKSTLLAAATFAIIIFFSFANELHAQEEYRITQPIPADIKSLYITSGWQVHIKQGDKPSIAIVTICHAFFDNDYEPEICKIEEEETLALLENKTMPKGTRIEITLARPLQYLYIAKDATVTTAALTFSERYNDINIGENAKVSGSVWRSPKSLDIFIDYNGSLKMDSIVAKDNLKIHQSEGASLDCPAMVSLDTKLNRARKVNGPIYMSDTAKHLKVKTRGHLSSSIKGMILSGGITAPIPLYMNNKQGSPYNRGENYRFNLQLYMITVDITKRLTFKPYLRFDSECSRLLNTVKKDGNALVLDDSHGALNPQQHLFSENLGLDYSFTYSIGQKNEKTGMPPYRLNFGMAVMYNISGRLVTRTMGDDNRWHRTREKVDVFNPWQLRAYMGIGGGPLTRATISLTYDLLPTFRSGIGADKLHTFGVNISF